MAAARDIFRSVFSRGSRMVSEKGDSGEDDYLSAGEDERSVVNPQASLLEGVAEICEKVDKVCIDSTKSGEDGDDEEDSDDRSDGGNKSQEQMLAAKLNHTLTKPEKRRSRRPGSENRANTSNDSDDEDSEAEPVKTSSSWWGSLISQASSTITNLSETVGGGISTLMESVDERLGIPDPAKLARMHDERNKLHDGEAEVTTGLDAVLESAGILDGGGGDGEEDAGVIDRLAEKVKGESSDEEFGKRKDSWFTKMTPQNIFEKVSNVLQVDKGRETIRELASRIKEVEITPMVEKISTEAKDVLRDLLAEFENDEFPNETSSTTFTRDLPQCVVTASERFEKSLDSDNIEILIGNYNAHLDQTTNTLSRLLSVHGRLDLDGALVLKNQALSCCIEISRLTKRMASVFKSQFAKETEARPIGTSFSKLVNNIYLSESEFYARLQQLIENIVS